MGSVKTEAPMLDPESAQASRPAPIRVFLADAQILMRHGLRMILSSETDIAIVGEAESGSQAIDDVTALRPDVVLMDIAMPGGDGIEAIRAIKHRSPATQVLVLTTHSHQDLFQEAAEAGAVGYVLKDISPGNLVNAIRAVHTGATMINPILARQMVEGFSVGSSPLASKSAPRPRKLTRREADILVAVAHGLSDKAIASKLFISESRVKNCLRGLYSRLKLRNRAHAAAFAVRRGLL